MEKKDDQNSQNNTEISLFNDNSTLSFIHKKAEKISCAIYILSNHLPEQEPMKWEIRNLSLELIKDIFLLKDYFSDDLFVIENLRSRILELASILDLMMNVGFVSEMNHGILRREIIDLSQFLDPKFDFTRSSRSIFGRDFFEIPRLLPKEKTEGFRNFENTSLEDDIKSFYLKQEKDKSSLLKGHFKGQKDKGHMSFNKMSLSELLGDTTSQSQSSKRRQEIIAFIKDKKEVTVKDISGIIEGCSEKTLQRDLVALVKAGVLKKKGERRWSKYSLA